MRLDKKAFGNVSVIESVIAALIEYRNTVKPSLLWRTANVSLRNEKANNDVNELIIE